MGQIKNIKLHIVTDIKTSRMSIFVRVTLLLALNSYGNGISTSSMASNNNNVIVDTTLEEMRKAMLVMQNTIFSLQHEIKLVKGEVKRGNHEREKMRNNMTASDTSFEDKSSN